MRSRSLLLVLFIGSLVAVPAASLPSPGLNGETTNSIPVIGRVFPEPLQTNDYISYDEAMAGLRFLNRTYPDKVELILVGKSVGSMNRMTNQRDPHDVYIVEVTNEKSPVPRENKIELLFMLSIHGNEKGGREGGFRVIEDFAKGNVGLLAEKPQLGALLDYFHLIFLFPNADGWTNDELQYGGVGYTRGNANGVDLNRQWPTNGFMDADRSHRTLSEPEVHSAALYLKEHYHNVRYASDIHGMLNPADGPETPPTPGASPAYPTEFQRWLQDNDKGHFILGMLPAGQMTQLEIIRTTRLGELVRERLQAHQAFAPWTAAPSTGVWGGNYVRWGAVWETIGYQVSGGSHDYFVSDTGLNAPSFSFEMAYNHIVCDSEYPGCGAFMNHFHVNNVRQIVATFMEAATKDIQTSISVNGHRTAYLFNPKVLTSEGDKPAGGWAANTTNDDRWEYTYNPYKATSNDFFVDFAKYVRDGDKPAVFDSMPANQITTESLARYDTFVVAGSAYEQIRGNGAAISTLKAWAEKGGNLVVTDDALQLTGDLGLVDAASIGTARTYMGYTDLVNLDHPLTKDRMGFSRQTFEAVPLGYRLGGSAPNWHLPLAEVQSKGELVGTVVLNQAGAPGGGAVGGARQANYGVLPLGQGKVTFLGALLPDPSHEYYHPYGLQSYAVTYAGNQFFINMLDFTQTFDAPPIVLESLTQPKPAPAASVDADVAVGKSGGSDTPGLGFLGILAALGAVIVVQRRRG